MIDWSFCRNMVISSISIFLFNTTEHESCNELCVWARKPAGIGCDLRRRIYGITRNRQHSLARSFQRRRLGIEDGVTWDLEESHSKPLMIKIKSVSSRQCMWVSVIYIKSIDICQNWSMSFYLYLLSYLCTICLKYIGWQGRLHLASSILVRAWK